MTDMLSRPRLHLQKDPILDSWLLNPLYGAVWGACACAFVRVYVCACLWPCMYVWERQAGRQIKVETERSGGRGKKEKGWQGRGRKRGKRGKERWVGKTRVLRAWTISHSSSIVPKPSTGPQKMLILIDALFLLNNCLHSSTYQELFYTHGTGVIVELYVGMHKKPFLCCRPWPYILVGRPHLHRVTKLQHCALHKWQAVSLICDSALFCLNCADPSGCDASLSLNLC